MFQRIDKRNLEIIARNSELWKRWKFENVARKVETVPRNFENVCT